MIDRIVTSVTMTFTKNADYHQVDRTITYVESTLASGTTKHLHERYERLTLEEKHDIVSILLDQFEVGSAIHVVGGMIVTQPTLFD